MKRSSSTPNSATPPLRNNFFVGYYDHKNETTILSEFPKKHDMMPLSTSYDLFLSHAWRFHEPWTRMVDLLDNHLGKSWRNFSVPWYDPAMDPNTPEGARYVHHNLEQQVRPTDAMLLLMDVYSVKSARKWLDMEIGFAKQFGVPIIAVGAPDQSMDAKVNFGQGEIWEVNWDGDSIIATLAEIRNAKSEGIRKP